MQIILLNAEVILLNEEVHVILIINNIVIGSIYFDNFVTQKLFGNAKQIKYWFVFIVHWRMRTQSWTGWGMGVYTLLSLFFKQKAR